MTEKIIPTEFKEPELLEEGADIQQAEKETPAEDEKSKRMRATRHFVEHTVLGIDPVLDDEYTAEVFNEMPVSEKVNLLYEKVLARQSVLKEETGDGEKPEMDPYLLGEIKSLWSDEAVQNSFLDRYTEARMDAKIYRLSDMGKNWDALNIVIDAKQKQYEHLTRDLFLQKITREDKLSIAKSRASRLARELIEKRQTREDILSLEGLDAVPENTDTVALIQYDRLQSMHEQAIRDGFVWLPSREKIYQRTIGALQNGRWPVLKGEAGTGKSELADAAARALTGDDPTHVPCGPKTGDRDLIMDKDIDPETGGSYDKYGALMQAATGFDDSRQEMPAYQQGRVVRLDEFNRLDQAGSAYSILKEARQLRPGSMFHGKKVLPGFSAIGTANPPGPRYPDRKEPDAAMRRETADIPVDYPPMSASEPELYEFVLATLMDKNGHITVSREELSPAYIKQKLDVPRLLSEGDPRFVTAEEHLVDDPTKNAHGFAWRLSFALRAVQDAFNSGNTDSVPADALRYDVAPSGEVAIVASGGEPLTFRSSTITLGEIASWTKGFQERKQKDNADFQTESLTEWIQYKLRLYIEQADSEDQEKLRAVFTHFHLFDRPTSLARSKPLTPKEIGYLSPRVPRPLELQDSGPEEGEKEVITPEEVPIKHELHETTSLVLEDGSQVLVRPRSFEIPHAEKNIYLSPGLRFRIHEEWLAFVGVVEDSSRPDQNGQLVVRINGEDPNSGLHRIITEEEVAEKGDEFWPFSSEEMSHEKLLNQYIDQVEVLKSTGILESPSGGRWGITGIDGKMYEVPSFQKVIERILKSQEQIGDKVEQGFTQLTLVPIGMPIGTRQESSKVGSTVVYKYTGLSYSYAELLRKKALENGGKLVAEKQAVGDTKEDIDLAVNEPLFIWDTIQGSDQEGATNQMIYYPKAFEASHGGVTKTELLKTLPDAGWDIILTQDLSVIPREGEGEKQGDRPAMETKGTNPYIQMETGKTTPSIKEYLNAIQNPEEGSLYVGEVGLTPEAWFTMAIHKLATTGEVMDDYQGKGRVSYLLGSYIAGRVPSACFDRDDHQAILGGNDPGDRGDFCGVRSAVRVP